MLQMSQEFDSKKAIEIGSSQRERNSMSADNFNLSPLSTFCSTLPRML